MSFTSALSSAIASAYCAYTSAAAGFYGTGPVSDLASARYVANLYRFANNLFCNRPTPNAAPPNSDPFSGGQCDEVDYTVTVSYAAERRSTNATESFGPINQRVIGPISRIYVDPGYRFFIDAKRPLIAADGDPTQVAFLSDSVYKNPRYTSIAVRRTDNAPDTCGNATPDYRPPVPPGSNVTNVNITYNDNSNNSVTVPVTLAFGFAFIDVSGTIQVPVSITGNFDIPVSFTANLNLGNGDVTYNFTHNDYVGDGCQPGGNTYKPDPTTPADPTGTTPPVVPPNPADPKDETEKVIRGALVTCTLIPSKRSLVPQNLNPDIYYTFLGNVQFLCRVGSQSGWTAAQQVTAPRQLIPCPWDGGAIDVAGTPIPGVEFTVSPVYERVTVERKIPSNGGS